ncbi:MAG TPA: TIGR03118 family protein [Chitinophagaceae bacterium]|nr:TIGR03118 family protein [Chitinophagaceae bacterium]
MEKLTMKTRVFFAGKFLLAALVLLAFSKCNKDDNNDNSTGKTLTQTNLVSNTSSGYAGARVDPNLVNAWGIAFSPTGNAWISAEGTGKVVVYNGNTGDEVIPAVTVGGSPTGMTYYGGSGFHLGNGNAAKYIIANENGTISGWNTGSSAEVVVNNAATAAYTGITIGNDNANEFIYAANLKEGRIDVFNSSFSPVIKPFTDPSLPSGYSPFNIENINGKLYVMYAKVDLDGEEETGAGLGYVDVYNTDGTLINRLISGAELNAPWSITLSPPGFASSGFNLLVGNFGDGRILVYNTDGTFKRALMANGSTVSIDGLWGITFAPAGSGLDNFTLYYAAGPNDENDGVFGTLK